MKLFVKAKEKPKCCFECPCFQNDVEHCCGLSEGDEDYFLDDIEGDNCPLCSLEEYEEKEINRICRTHIEANEKLKQQLAELDSELAENVRENECLKEQLAEKEKEIDYKTSECKKWQTDYENCSRLEKIMTKEYQWCLDNWRACEQDKLDFAIAKLEKLKEFAEKQIKECNKLLQEEFEDDYYIQSVNARQSMCYEFRREIYNQIKELKEK